ncbi:MAG: AAA family ATPase [Ignavibacteria bacterium]|nr:AAA family ATPase [Ignavibacteria bacterium]
MFNSIQNISAYARIIPSPEVIPLKFQTSLHQNLFILIILLESKEKIRFNFNTNPFLHLLYKKINNKVIIIISLDAIKNNLNLFLNFSHELSLISGIKIWGDYKREIYDKENPDALFYKISQQNLPLSNSSIFFSKSLYNCLKRLCLFEKFIHEENEYFIPLFKEKKKNKYFFGRESELKILNKNYNRIKYEYSGESHNIITVKGEPGIGKTSLVKAFLTEGESKNYFFITYPSTIQPYEYFLQFMNSLLDQKRDFKSAIKNFASSVRDSKLRKNLIDSIPHFPQYFSKENYSNYNEERSQNTILAFRNLVLAYADICASQRKPLILAFDDIQWADVSSMKTINFILEDFKNNFERCLPIQFIFIYRAGYTIGVKPDSANSTELELNTLDSAASHNYLQELLRINDLNLSKKNQASLLAKSGGNPLFLEEIVEHIKYNNNEIPASVKEIIKQRFFSLPEKFANFLKACSVIGKEIDLRMANHVLHRFNSEEISENYLEYLVQNKFLNKTHSLIEFKHDLIKESIYDSLDESEKKTLHDFAGITIEKIYSEKIENYYYQLAEHFTQADNREKMIEYLEKAGDRARRVDDYRLAEKYYEKVFYFVRYFDNPASLSEYCEILIILGNLDKLKNILTFSLRKLKSETVFYFKLLVCEARLHYLKSNYSVSKNLFRKLYKKKLNYPDNLLKIEILKGLLDSYIQLNMLNKILPLISEFEKFSENKNYYAQNFINEYRGRIYFKKGHYHKALESYNKVFEVVSTLNLKRTMGNILIKIGGIHFGLCNFIEAKNCFQKAIKINEQVGNYRNLAICHGNLANLFIVSGLIQKAHTHLMIQQKIITVLNDKFSLAVNYNSLGNCYLNKENYTEAEKSFSKMFEIVKESNLKNLFNPVFSNLGVVNMLLGNFQKALYYFDVQCKAENGFLNPETKIKWNFNLSYIYRRKKKFYKAIEYDLEALSLAEKTGNKSLTVSGLLNMSLNFFYQKNFLNAQNYVVKLIEFYDSEKLKKIDQYYEAIFYNEMYSIILNEKLSAREEILKKINAMKKIIASIDDVEIKYELSYYLLKICRDYNICSTTQINIKASNLMKIYLNKYEMTKKYNCKVKIEEIKKYLLN